eukprot:sb/3478666/
MRDNLSRSIATNFLNTFSCIELIFNPQDCLFRFEFCREFYDRVLIGHMIRHGTIRILFWDRTRTSEFHLELTWVNRGKTNHWGNSNHVLPVFHLVKLS